MPECGRSEREGMYLLVGDGSEVRAGVRGDVVVLERVDALELARMGMF